MSQQKTIQDSDITQLSNQHSGSRRVGPLELTYTVNVAEEKATVSASMMGVSLGSRTLTLYDSQGSLGGNISLYNVDADFSINFQEKKLGVFVDVNMMGKAIYKGNVTLLDW